MTPKRMPARSAKENLGEVLSAGEEWESDDRVGPSDGDRVRPRVYATLGGYALRFASSDGRVNRSLSGQGRFCHFTGTLAWLREKPVFGAAVFPHDAAVRAA